MVRASPTKDAWLLWAAQSTAGNWYIVAVNTLRNIHSAKFAKEIGMTMPGHLHGADCSEEQPWIQQEVDLWQKAWRLDVELSSARRAIITDMVTCVRTQKQVCLTIAQTNT